MSTGATSNLGLHQWVLDDPFLMEEMNEDNRKIDAAWPRVKLFDITTTAALANIDLDVSEIDLTEYLQLDFYISLNGAGGTPALRLNSYTGQYANWYGTGSTTKAYMNVFDGHSVLDIFSSTFTWVCPRPAHQPGGGIALSALGSSGLESMNFFNTTGSDNFPAGTKILVYGVKK